MIIAGRRLPLLLVCLLASLGLRLTLGVGLVRGLSMWPSLKPGDTVLYARVLGPAAGSIVVADLPCHGLIIKRAAIVDRESCFLLGDNRDESYDSRSFGPLRQEQVVGRVIAVWPGQGPGHANARPGSSSPAAAD